MLRSASYSFLQRERLPVGLRKALWFLQQWSRRKLRGGVQVQPHRLYTFRSKPCAEGRLACPGSARDSFLDPLAKPAGRYERSQLASDFPGGIDVPRWSPDGTKLVFQGIREGHPWNIYVVPAAAGATQELLPNDRTHEFPDWLADGESVVYSNPRASQKAPREDSGIFVLDLKTRKVTRVPGSDGLKNPRTSFGGRYLAALTEDQTKLMLFDFQTHDWREIASNGKLFYFLESTPDGKWLYFQDLLEAGAPLYRAHELAIGKLSV